MEVRPRLAVLVSVAALGCWQTTYRPYLRPDHATAVVVASGVRVVVPDPRILAISLVPPFECDAATLRLAREGPVGAFEEEPENIDAFSDLDAPMGEGVFRVRTFHGDTLAPGPRVIVISGDRKDDPAVSALNVVNRYNDVAECLRRSP